MGRIRGMRILIRNGLIVTASDTQSADLLIEDGRIARLGAALAETADRTIDATGHLVLPGAVDPHTHLDMPVGSLTTSDDFETGTRAAAMGGTTTIIDFANPEPGQSLHDAVACRRRRADGRAVVDYGLHVSVPWVDTAVEAELEALVDEGMPSFKVFMAYPGRLMLDDGAILRVLSRAASKGGLVMLHAENGHVVAHLTGEALAAGHRTVRYHAATRLPISEAEAILRGIVLAEVTGAALYVVHVSTAEGTDAIAAARQGGAQVIGETCPHYLLLSDREYTRPEREAAAFVMSPPLRPDGHQDRLWRALAEGDLQVVATDHCPFNRHVGADESAAVDFTQVPSGVPGIEHRLSLLYDAGVRTGRLSLPRLVEVTSTAASRVFGLYPRKGSLTPGADADVVVFNPERRFTISAASHHMRVDNNPYEGRETTGAPSVVLAQGEVIVEDGRFVGRPGTGRFLRRAPFGV